jgi:ribosomal protein S18 acetylase RimI-like enzyme
VPENNPGALAFWRDAGFRETGQRDTPGHFKSPLLTLERQMS